MSGTITLIRRVIVIAGPGNNGGDALAMARHLADRQYRVNCYLLGFGKLSRDCALNRQRLMDQALVQFYEIGEGDPLPAIDRGDVVVDGIFGSGLSRPVSGFPAKIIAHINKEAGDVISIDIPSGLMGEDNSGNDYKSVIRANHTLTFQFPFLSFFFRENDSYVGNWRVHDIGLHPEAIKKTETPYQTIEKEQIRHLLPRRNRFAHKGYFWPWSDHLRVLRHDGCCPAGRRGLSQGRDRSGYGACAQGLVTTSFRPHCPKRW